MTFSKKNFIILGIIVLVLVLGITLTFRSKKTNTIETNTTNTLDFDIESEEPTSIPTIVSKPTSTPILTKTQSGISTAIVTKIPTITPTRIPTRIPTITPTLKPQPTKTPTATPTPDTNIYATGIVLNTTQLTLEINKSYKVDYRVEPNETTDKNVSWSSSDGHVATVTSDAWITANNIGEVTITASTVNNMTTSIKVKVIESKVTPTTVPTTILPTTVPTTIPTTPILVSYPSKIDLNLSRLILPVSETKQFSVLLQPQNVKNKGIVWSISNGSIATITADGLLTAKSIGKINLTVTSENNLTDTATITVVSSYDSISQATPTQKPTPTPTETIYPPITPPVGSSLKRNNNSSSLITSIERKSGYYLTRIWVKDPYSQIRKAITSRWQSALETVNVIANTEVSRKNLKNKILVAINASGLHSGAYEYQYCTSSTKLQCKYTAFGTYIKLNGQVLRDYRNEAAYDFNTTIFGIDKNGNIQAWNDKKGSSRPSSPIFKQIDDAGVRDTFAFYYGATLIVKNGKNVYGGVLNEATRQTFCQINKNNFLIATINSGYTLKKAADLLISLGCQTGINLDGGGSTALVYKKPGESATSFIYKGSEETSNGRRVADILYITEL